MTETRARQAVVTWLRAGRLLFGAGLVGVVASFSAPAAALGHSTIQPSRIDAAGWSPRPLRHLVYPEELVEPPAALPAPPPPVVFSQLPVDSSVVPFVPMPARLTPAASVPSALPGHSDSITLTFDDCGSADQIQAVVNALAAVGRHALFFVTGQCRDHFPWLVDTLKAAGHSVCNHTYSHPDLRRLSDAAIRAQIAGGVFAGCPYFRPPFGLWDGPRGRVARIAAAFGLTVMLWDVDSRDWAGAGAAPMAAMARARGGVILFHLHGANTAEAVRLLG